MYGVLERKWKQKQNRNRIAVQVLRESKGVDEAKDWADCFWQ